MRNLVIVSFLTAYSLVTSAQDKKELRSTDYNKWSKTTIVSPSDDGNWIKFTSDYSNGVDTLYVKNVNTDKLLIFPGGFNGKFVPLWFGYQKSNRVFQLVNLKSTKSESIMGVSDFEFSTSGKYLILKFPNRENTNEYDLVIRNLKTGLDKKIKDVTSYKEHRDTLAIVRKIHDRNFLEVNKLGSSRVIFNSTYDGSLSGISWHSSGESIAFFESMDVYGGKINKVHFITIEKEVKEFVFDPTKYKDFPEGYGIDKIIFFNIIISDDQQRIFFNIVPQPETILDKGLKTSDKPNVEIWNSRDRYIYSQQADIDGLKFAPKLSVWWPNENKFYQIATGDYPKAKLTGDQKHAILFNLTDYKPQEKYVHDYLDLYILDLATGKQKIFLKKQLNRSSYTLVSPHGKYISYFRNANWWVYDIYADKHTNVTRKIKEPLNKEFYDYSGSPAPYGNPGWIGDDEELIIHDRYDIWLIDPLGKHPKKITNGKKDKIVCRIYDKLSGNVPRHIAFGFENNAYKWKDNLIIKMDGELSKKSGFSYWNSKEKLRSIVFKDMMVDNLTSGTLTNRYFYTQEDYAVSPQIVVSEKSTSLNSILFKSNAQQDDFFWGKSQLISYTSVEGIPLQGVLFYPANFKTGKKYPMVVRIYENLSQNLHRYINPSLEDLVGFNISNFSSDGYFVLEPDIHFIRNNPGVSALHSVVPAVEKALELGVVDSTRIGLSGHSFGGYETSYIIGQTNIFTAAIAGSPITDLVSSYLSMGKDNHNIYFWRFEGQQMRMPDSFFKNPDAYYKNSPIHHASGIHTPLLIWSGTSDQMVDYTQGLKLYLALRRLDRESILLLYPNQDHILDRIKDQVDITQRTKEWFDFYLKKKKAVDWITNTY